MPIAKNSVVNFHYRLLDSDGSVLEDSKELAHPMAYLHGHDNMVPEVEQALEGKAAGDSVETTLTEPYGPYREGQIQRVPIKRLRGKQKPVVGGFVTIPTKEGNRQLRVVKVGRFNVDVDTNHPYAGKTLTYQIDVVDIRDASEEELAHGHVHGPGGHHH